MLKLSKTGNRNSKEPLFDDEVMLDSQPLNAQGEPNLDSIRVLNWADLFITKTVPAAAIIASTMPVVESTSQTVTSADPFAGLAPMNPIDKVVAWNSSPQTDINILCIY